VSWAPNQAEFNRAQLVTFLRAVDHNLSDPLTVIVIGGSAAILGYNSPVRTSDVDLFESSGNDFEAFKTASAAAREETGLAIGVEVATVADIPDSYQDRVREAKISGLENLTIAVPDKYDLALSKTLRCMPHDVEAIAGIHERHPFAIKIFVDRFESELLPIATMDRRILCMNVTMMAARLWGMDEAGKLARRWGVTPPMGLLPKAISKRSTPRGHVATPLPWQVTDSMATPKSHSPPRRQLPRNHG
jgi:hypothetical protein